MLTILLKTIFCCIKIKFLLSVLLCLNIKILFELFSIFSVIAVHYAIEPWINAKEALEFMESSSNEIFFELMKNFYSQKLKDISFKNAKTTERNS